MGSTPPSRNQLERHCCTGVERSFLSGSPSRSLPERALQAVEVGVATQGIEQDVSSNMLLPEEGSLRHGYLPKGPSEQLHGLVPVVADPRGDCRGLPRPRLAGETARELGIDVGDVPKQLS